MAGWGLVPFWLKPDQLAKQPYSTITTRRDYPHSADISRALQDEALPGADHGLVRMAEA